MDVPRCICSADSAAPGCRIHGVAGADPNVPWKPTQSDKAFLQSIKVDPEK